MFVTLEGLDGSGKSTVVESLADEFNAKVTAEPSTNWTGRQVRHCLSSNDTHSLTDFFFFMGDRVDHIENEIKPWIDAGNMVISDRYADSTRAYQSVALAPHFEGEDEEKKYIENVMSSFRYEPDLTLYLDISVDTAIERCDEEEKYENREFLEKVSENYEKVVNHFPRVKRIDAEQSKEDVVRDSVEVIESYL